MSSVSQIEWLQGGASWNPVRGCTPCAPECANCYARTFAERWRGIAGHPYERGFDPRTVPDALDLPLRWKKPRTIFVNSMSDLFHAEVPDDFIEAVLGVASLCGRHHLITLTKRAERLRDFMSRTTLARCQAAACVAGVDIHTATGRARADRQVINGPWPLPNVTLGVSVGTRARLSELDLLRATPAARRMVSFEPLLEDLGDVDLHGIDVAAIGGESGPGARPCDVAWIRRLVARCRAAGCAPFVKQLGANIHDRNDAGFDGNDGEWPEDTRVEHDEADTGYQGAPVRVRTRNRKGADMNEWPADLRVREMPEVHHA